MVWEPGAVAGLRAGNRRADKEQRLRAGPRPQRATQYIEFHGGVRLPHVYLPARSLHIYGTCRVWQVAASGCGSRGGSYGSWCKFM